jgi:galactokinase/mevalonate kinase-like predicted kinase
VSAVEATAPCRVDLAGAALDVWPTYLFHRGAVAVGVAIDRRAWARVETGTGGVRIESKDSLRRAESATVLEVLAKDGGALVAHVLDALGVESGVSVVTQCRVPDGAGLGEESAVAVAVAAATCHALGRPVDPDALSPLVRDALTRSRGRAAGVLDARIALAGGALAVHLDPGAVREESLEVDPARIEECLLLVQTGEAETGGAVGRDAGPGPAEGGEATREDLAGIAAASRGVHDALLAGRFDDVAPLAREQWEAGRRLSPAAVAPAVDKVVETAREAGAAAWPCAGGGGRVVAVWAPPGRRGPGSREAVEQALGAAGMRSFAARVDLRGLEVG